MKKMVVVISIIWTSVVWSQIWILRYNSGGGYDSLTAMTVDAYGNIYVTGKSYVSYLTGYDYATLKCSPLGEILWVRRYEGTYSDVPNAIAEDGSGNVYVTGRSMVSALPDWDYLTVKYDANGVEKWVRSYDDGDSAYGDARSMALESGMIYITGYCKIGLISYALTLKYNGPGYLLWTKRYSISGSGYGRAIAAGSGMIYVAGYYEYSGQDHNYFIVKYTPLGTEEWAKQYNGPADSTDEVRAITIDNSGNVYVTGCSIGLGTGYDYATIKYNSAGGREWVARYNGPGNGSDAATAIAVDASGNVYVTGYSIGSGTGYDYATIKYNSAGQEVWVRRYEGPYDNFANAIAVDDSGNVYITGASDFSGSNDYDYFTIKYNSAGTVRWTKRYIGPGGDDRATQIALYDGYVYVSGTSVSSGGSKDYLIIKYLAVGVEEDAKSEFIIPKLEVSSNIFARSSFISYWLPIKSRVRLKLYDLTGKFVKTLVDKKQNPGKHTVNCDFSPGIYFIKLSTENFNAIQKVIILK